MSAFIDAVLLNSPFRFEASGKQAEIVAMIDVHLAGGAYFPTDELDAYDVTVGKVRLNTPPHASARFIHTSAGVWIVTINICCSAAW